MKRRFSPRLMLLAAVILLAAVFIFNYQQLQAQADRPMPARAAQAERPQVAVIQVEAGSHQASISGYGAAEPHFALTLTAQASGQIEQLSPAFESGNTLNRGAVLLTLEQSSYQAAVANAEQALASARLALLEEERQGIQARREWEASGQGGTPDSELVLRQPQLAAARAAVSSAKASLASARKDLASTQIRAPFDALVVKRLVAPGSYLQPGSDIATLYSTDRLEIRVALSERDWQNLPDPDSLGDGQWPVELQGVEERHRWRGRVLRTERHLDGDTRQRALIVAVDRPLAQQPALLPGTFLQVEIAGRTRDQLWALPSSALTQRGEIWYLSADDSLASFKAEPLFSRGETIFVAPPESLIQAPQRILVHPLASYLKGMAVKPMEAASDA